MSGDSAKGRMNGENVLIMESGIREKNKIRWNTVSEQWEEILRELLSHALEKERAGMKNVCVQLWRDLKSEELVPCNDERSPLLPYLEKAAENARLKLDLHMNKKPSLLGKGQWKNKKHVLEVRNKYLHNMSLTCAAMELSQRKNERRKNRPTVNLPPSAPPPLPPPNQLPQFQVTSGLITAEVVSSQQHNMATEVDRRMKNLESFVNESIHELKRTLVQSCNGSIHSDITEEESVGNAEAVGICNSDLVWQQKRIQEANEERLIELEKQMSENARRESDRREIQDRERLDLTQHDQENGREIRRDGTQTQGTQASKATLTGTLTLHSTPQRYDLRETMARKGPTKTVGIYPVEKKNRVDE